MKRLTCLFVFLGCWALIFASLWGWRAWRDADRAVPVPPAPVPGLPAERDTAASPAPDRTATLPDTAGPPAAAPPAARVFDFEPPQRLPSGLIIPVAGIRPEDLVDTFEEARAQNREHNAIDIIAPRGTPALAAADGRIVRLFTSDEGGLTLYQLAPDDRTVYYYAHLDGYAPGVAEGVFAEQGAVLGFVGDTGNAVPGNYHLHFAIWTIEDPAGFWDGDPVNPFPLLRGN